MRIHVVSESPVGVRAHGVHSAYVGDVEGLRNAREVDLATNGVPRRRSDIVHVHTLGPYSMAMLAISGRKRVISAHLTPDSLLGSVVAATQFRGLFKRYIAWAYNRADLVIAVSEQTQQELRREGVNSPIAVLRNAVPCFEIAEARAKRQLARRGLGIGEDTTVIIAIGQMQPRKGLAEFIETARRFPKLRFIWVGDVIFGALSARRKEMHRLVSDAPDNIHFPGAVPGHRVYELLGAADIYVSCSKHETFGLASMEAAASSLPLVLSDIPVHRAIYEDGANYADGLDEIERHVGILARDTRERRIWGLRAREVAARHDVSEHIAGLVALYSQILTSGP